MSIQLSSCAAPSALSAGVSTQAPATFTPETQKWFVDQSWEYPLVEGVAAPDGIPPLADLQGPDIALAELEDLPGTLTMLQDVGLT